MVDEKALRAAFAVNHHPESEPSETELAKLRGAITAYMQALSPGSTGETEGWVLVPKELTNAMLWANAGTSDTHKPTWNRAMWAAFLAAAPAPPSAMLSAAEGR